MNFDKSNAVYQHIQKLERNFRTTIILPIKKIFYRRKLKKNVPLFIYQMGKVASTSVYRSLLKQYSGAIAHAHTLSEPDWKATLVYDWYKKGRPVKIITLTREPISRNVASFFQKFETYVGKPFGKSTHSVQELQSIFFDSYEHSWPLNWFDHNIKRYFDIDVYTASFPKSGYVSYSKGNIEVLVIKSEINDKIKEQAIREFTGLPEFKLENANIGSQKEYAETYKKFKSTLTMSDEYRRKFTESKYYKHFYS
jgi:hypothetical protein